MKQFFLPQEPKFSVRSTSFFELQGKPFHYLIHVLRLHVGDIIPALSPKGIRYSLTLEHIQGHQCRVRIQPDTQLKPVKDIGTNITVIPALTKGRKMDLTIRQSVECGARRIWPTICDHCQVQFKNPKETTIKTERWKRIAVEALQQSGGPTPADLQMPAALMTVVERWNERGPIFFFHERAHEENASLHSLLAEKVDELAIVVGPEGGFSEREVRDLQAKKAQILHLGERILRAETAVVYGIAAISTIIRERTEWILG